MPVNSGQPEAAASRLARLRDHLRAAVEDLGRLRWAVETQTLARIWAATSRLARLEPVGGRFGEALHRLGAASPAAFEGGWHGVVPNGVDGLFAGLGPEEASGALFQLLERVDELQGVVEWLIDCIEPVLVSVERLAVRSEDAGEALAMLDAAELALIERLTVLATALDRVLGLRLLDADAAPAPGVEAALEQVRAAAR